MIFLPVNGELQLLKGQSERIFLRAKSMRHPLFVQSVSCNLRGVNSFQTIFIFRFALYDIDITTFMTDIFN